MMHWKTITAIACVTVSALLTAQQGYTAETIEVAPEESSATSERAAPADLAPRGLKLFYVSERQCVLAAVDNNLDIAVAELDPKIAATEIERALAVFDTYALFDATFAETNEPSISILQGGAVSSEDHTILGGGLRKKFPTGTVAEVRFASNSSGSNNSLYVGFLGYGHFYDADLTFSLTQPLLKNAGIAVNMASTTIARNNLRVSEQGLEFTTIDVLNRVSQLYWSLVFSIEDLRVRRKSLDLAKNLLRNSQLRAEAGDLAYIEVTRAQASVASQEADIIEAETTIGNVQDELKRALNLPEFVLTDNVVIWPSERLEYSEVKVDTTEAIKTALARRQDLNQFKTELKNKDVQIVLAENQLWPSLDMVATYNLNGLGQEFGGASGRIFNGGRFPDRSLVLSFEYPLENRDARAGCTRAQLEKIRVLRQYKNLEDQVVIQVREAARNLNAAYRSAKARGDDVTYARTRLDEEDQRYALGMNTSLDVLEAQDNLARAEREEARSIAFYRNAEVTLHQTIGDLLDYYNIIVTK